jgi:hypothetical protein
MANMIEINLKPDNRTLRQFGWIALVGFGAVAALAWYELLIFSGGWLGGAKQTFVMVLGGLAAYSAVFSLIFPKANLPIYLGLTILSYPIGFVLSHVIMGALWYLIITPVGIMMRIAGNDPMDRAWDPEAETYWNDCGPPRPKESYFRQF